MAHRVYWALGISGGLLIVLVGYNAFSTFVLSDREKKNIARELEADIQSRFLDEREAIQKQLDGHAGRLDSLVERNAKKIYSDLDKKMDDLKQKLFFVSYNVKEIEANQWLEQKVHGNAISVYADMLSEVIEYRRLEWCSIVLEAILKVYSDAKKANEVVDVTAYVRAELNRQLNRLPPEYQSNVNIIRQKLEQVD